MQTARRSTASAIAAALFLVLPALTVASASAATDGSTDVYRNEFVSSFGVPASASFVRATTPYSGATDIWANSFRTSFGAADSSARSVRVCSSGSTDIWANSFSASFTASASQSAGDLAQACRSGAGRLL
jgi:hypothetical protein